MWHPTTGELFYLYEETGYYNIHKAGKVDGPVLKLEKDFGGSAPGWGLGQQGFTFLNDGRLATVYAKDVQSVLLLADVSSDIPDVVEYGMDDGLPMQFGSLQTDPVHSLCIKILRKIVQYFSKLSLFIFLSFIRRFVVDSSDWLFVDTKVGDSLIVR